MERVIQPSEWSSEQVFDIFRRTGHMAQAKNRYQNVVETTKRVSVDTIRPYHRAAMLRAEFNL